ncbi:superoxide dismutase, Ni [Patescibacteria group bacterium]|nr:superoxide dismutase, Ni [Patescibacteria group bacterium]
MFNLFKKPKVVYAHCDIPCGIYDPHEAQLSVLTVIRMMDLIADSEDDHDTARYIAVKEAHAEKCKHEIRVMWGDYFKEEHIEEYPELHDLTHRIMALGSKVKQNTEREVAEELLGAVNEFAEIFWKTKGVEIKKIKAPYGPEEEVFYPDL